MIVASRKQNINIRTFEQFYHNDIIITQYSILKIGGQIKGNPGNRGAVVQKNPVPWFDKGGGILGNAILFVQILNTRAAQILDLTIIRIAVAAFNHCGIAIAALQHMIFAQQLQVTPHSHIRHI